jgi:hypothetical protein
MPLKRSGWLAVSCLVAACALAPPVQEMSDARQAVAAAREAGAARYAPAILVVAEQRLADAEQALRSGGYGAARRSALAARAQAVEALQVSRGASSSR